MAAHSSILRVSLVAQVAKNLVAMGEDLSSIPELGRSPGERNDYAQIGRASCRERVLARV